MKKETTLERRIEKIKQELMALGAMRPGSLSIQSRSWGGEYGQLSYTHQGKGHTEYVSKKNREEVERQIANYRKFKKLTGEWVELGIELCKLKTKKKIEK
ncbi:MAG: hypothetical protein L3K26_04185 [Candidatus Hydrogenedentes bacterium]|nr:hypothetical protein [Candidatus Hydrogenedentota bacterium]